MSGKTYSVTIISKSGDKVLTELKYPDLNYGKFVEAQAAIGAGLIRAGIERALLKGEVIEDVLQEMYGVAGK